ncbi:MAG: PstS family phosphate ABC transporter substrate-binding protein [Xanthobacteraceae bacterium]
MGPKAAGILIAAILSSTAPAVAGAKLSVVGTGDGLDVLRAIAVAFSRENRSIQVLVPPSIHSRGGIVAVASGREILGRVARKLTPAEAAIGIVYKPVFRLPAAFYAHPTVGVSSVSTRQIADMYSGRITNWSQVSGIDQRVRVVRREEPDSTFSVLRETMPGWRDLVVTERSKVATTTQDSIETVREVPGAIGFGPFSKNLEQGTVVLKIDGNYPTDPKYPSSIELALIYIEKNMTPESRAFMAFVESRKARATIEGLGSVPVSP